MGWDGSSDVIILHSHRMYSMSSLHCSAPRAHALIPQFDEWPELLKIWNRPDPPDGGGSF